VKNRIWKNKYRKVVEVQALDADGQVQVEKLAFYPISAVMSGRLLQSSVGPALARLYDAIDDEEGLSTAIAALASAVGKDLPLAGAVILDALHEEEGYAPAPSGKKVDEFLQELDGPMLAQLLSAVARVNAEGFRPQIAGLRRQAPEPAPDVQSQAPTELLASSLS
jgi:hypothetical protein